MEILIASHGLMAKGILSATEIIVGKSDSVCALSAYIDDVDFNQDLSEYMQTREEVCVLSDLFGGSVNQKIISYMQSKKVYLVTGVNLAMAIEIILANNNGELNEERIREICISARDQVIYVNDKLVEKFKDDF